MGKETLEELEDGGAYEVSLPVFDGPMDLLLHLVRKNRIDIHDIPIHEITDQYLSYLDEARHFDLALGSSFFVMAATLIYIKSRTLLPRKKEEESGEEENPKRELEQALEEFSRVKEIRARLSALMEAESPYRTRPPADLKGTVFTGVIPLKRLEAAFFSLYDSMKKEEKTEILPREEVSLDSQMQSLRGLMTREGIIKADDFFHLQHTRARLAMALVALLELIRLGEAALEERAEGLLIMKGKEGKYES